MLSPLVCCTPEFLEERAQQVGKDAGDEECGVNIRARNFILIAPARRASFHGMFPSFRNPSKVDFLMDALNSHSKSP